jgi:hypothetical protein
MLTSTWENDRLGNSVKSPLHCVHVVSAARQVTSSSRNAVGAMRLVVWALGKVE